MLLLVEVADTSLPYDRTIKLPLYAGAGVREVWLLDLVRDRVEVHRDPSPDGFHRTEIRERGASAAPEACPGVAVAIDELLG